MLTDEHISDIQHLVDTSNSNEELLSMLKSYFLSSNNIDYVGEPLNIAWKVYLNIIQTNRIQ